MLNMCFWFSMFVLLYVFSFSHFYVFAKLQAMHFNRVYYPKLLPTSNGIQGFFDCIVWLFPSSLEISRFSHLNWAEHLCTHNGANESNESDEGHEGDESCQRCHDRDPGLRFRRRDLRIEVQGREGRCWRYRDRRGRAIEEKWLFQVRWGLEPETQEEASPPCSQRCESIHQRAMRVQGKASKQDGPCLPDEEAQGDDQLRCSNVALCTAVALSYHGRGGRTHQAHSRVHVLLPLRTLFAHSPAEKATQQLVEVLEPL